MSAEIINGVYRFIDHFTKLTVRIATFNDKGEMIGRSSGFLLKKDSTSPVVIITAGHKLTKKGSFIETKIRKDNKMVLLNAGEFNIFYNGNDIDFAFSILSKEYFKDKSQANKEKDTELVTYQYDFNNAIKNEAYGFAVVNDFAEFIEDKNGFILPSYCCFEVGLELERQDEHINYFKTARPFQGDEYYRGASGSPIADPEGIITSILIGGTDDGLLKAFRLDNFNLNQKIETVT